MNWKSPNEVRKALLTHAMPYDVAKVSPYRLLTHFENITDDHHIMASADILRQVLKDKSRRAVPVIRILDTGEIMLCIATDLSPWTGKTAGEEDDKNIDPAYKNYQSSLFATEAIAAGKSFG